MLVPGRREHATISAAAVPPRETFSMRVLYDKDEPSIRITLTCQSN